MLNTANILSVKEIVDKASSLLGLNYIDTKISLFLEDDQNSKQLLTILKSAVSETAQDLFDKRLGLSQEYLHLTPERAPEKDLHDNDIWIYSIFGQNIYRLYETFGDGKKLYRVQNLEDLKQNNYILEYTNIKTKVRFNKLSLLKSSSNFYASVATSGLTFKQKPESDSDLVMFDSELTTYAFCRNFTRFRGLEDLIMFFEEKYKQRLIYLIEESFEDSKPIRIC